MSDYDYEIEHVRRVVDGDTFDLTLAREVDFGFYLVERKRFTLRVRLLDVDAHETREQLGAQATIFASGWLAGRRGRLRATTYKTDAFGRWLAVIYDGVTRERLADALLRAGLAVPYPRG